MKKGVLTIALTAIAANPTLTHMRRVAYSPVSLPISRSFTEAEEKKEAAEAKRIKRQQRNIKNAQK